MYLLDTNICIYFISKRYPQVSAHFSKHQSSDLAISSIVAAELAAGVVKSTSLHRDKNRANLEVFMGRIKTLAWDESAIWHFAEQKTRLWREGKKIGDYDLLIAAQALALNATLVTNNTKEFERIDGLRLENWV